MERRRKGRRMPVIIVTQVAPASFCCLEVSVVTLPVLAEVLTMYNAKAKWEDLHLKAEVVSKAS